MNNNLIKGGVYTVDGIPDTVYVLISECRNSCTFIRMNITDLNLKSIQKNFEILISGKQTHELKPFMSNFIKSGFLEQYDGFLGKIDLTNVKIEGL